MKLDFSKAYDKVSWRFLFSTMQKMNISEKFISWVKLLFENASATINLNGSLGENFRIEREVMQGCPLAPYLFLIVGEVLTHIIKRAVSTRRLRGGFLPRGENNRASLSMRITHPLW